MTSLRPRRDGRVLLLALTSIAGITAGFRVGLHLVNPTTTALAYLLIVLVAAAAAHLWVAIVTSIVADLSLNYFFMPPFGTLSIADPQNWAALFVFLAVSVIASRLSTAARDRERESSARRDELGRLFDLSREVLLSTDSTEAIRQLVRFVARRFDLEFAAVCLPRAENWDVYEGGTRSVRLDHLELSRAFAGAERGLEFDARARTHAGHRTITAEGEDVRLVPLRSATKVIGLLAGAGRPIEPGTLDALAGVVAIAVERAQFLEERKAAALARQSEELMSVLLASLAHDLKTPLTAIRVAAANLRSSWLQDADRREQEDVVLTEVERLQRLFQNILEMARIDAGAIATELRWVHPAEIFEAARGHVEHTLKAHGVEVDSDTEDLVRLDPRLTASALAHLLENAAQYSPPASPISVRMSVSPEGLTIAVRDHGRGIAPRDLPRLFDRFYRGEAARRRTSGTGMGLSIARGMLAAEGGHIRAENCRDGGARFTIVVPAESRATAAADHV